MTKKSLLIISIVCVTTLVACSQNNTQVTDNKAAKTTVQLPTVSQEPHQYGGWYCPDNLGGFPAVDIKNWKSVPVVNGRMPTKEETQNGTSLIFIDTEKYPNAKVLDIEMPKLARYYSLNTKKEEIVIVIQAIQVQNDSVVGFRYLNGGNGSARLNEVKFLSDKEIADMAASRFVSLNINIDASQAKVWDILTKPAYYTALRPTFDKENSLETDWHKSSKVNFNYLKSGTITSEFANDLYGNKYIQIDFEQEDYQYVEKFLLLTNEQTKNTELQILCGPYADDFETQKIILENWAQKVKELSEKR